MAATTRTRQVAAYASILEGQRTRAGLGAPIRDAFFTTKRDGVIHHPLAALVNSTQSSGGGRGGKTRVMLYLSLLWIASGQDHSATRPARWWAELLGMSDPQGAGSRSIRNSWVELERRKFVSITAAPASGDVPTIRLLKEDGSGDAYTIPEGHGGDTYRRIPQTAWRTLFHSNELSSPGLTMFLVALRTYGQAQGRALTFPREYFQTEYGMGETTRKAGLRNLTILSVLGAEGRSVEVAGTGSRRRGRTEYQLLEVFIPPAPVINDRTETVIAAVAPTFINGSF